MKERPILFSGPMVNAILEGRKTQTRRIIKPQPVKKPESALEHGDVIIDAIMGNNEDTDLFKLKESKGHGKKRAGLLNAYPYHCPHGNVGDRLWVRETWAHYQPVLNYVRPSGATINEISDGCAAYRADGYTDIEDLRTTLKMNHGLSCDAIEINGNKWRPSIHMPRWASRINLEITDIRVERVQEISEADAMAEGIPVGLCRIWFKRLWNSINGPDAWERNDWVWVVGFKGIE